MGSSDHSTAFSPKITTEIVSPDYEPLSDDERQRLIKMIDDKLWDMFKAPPQPETTYPLSSKRCPDCRMLFPCAKHMVC